MKISGVEISVDPTKTKKIVVLRNVTDLNNNKFYHMYDMGDGTMICEWGRIGSHLSKKSYPISEWDKIYKKKTSGNRGIEGTYTDVTDITLSGQTMSVNVTNNKTTSEIDNSNLTSSIQSIMNDLINYSKNSIRNNYSVNVDTVTELQVKEAQDIIDHIYNNLVINVDTEYINDSLLKLYKIIPRKMTNVKNYLLPKYYKVDENSLQEAKSILSNEQSTLDVMRQAVSQNQKSKVNVNTDKQKNILEVLDIEMNEASNDEIVMIKNLLGSNRSLFKRAFKIEHKKTEPRFRKFINNRPNQSTKLFWHGSRNENWLSILESGLVLRPTNVIITGKMFGYGLYYADRAQKSIGYTSLNGSYWASGHSNKAYLALFKVHTGNELKVLGNNSKYPKHESWMYNLTEKKLKEKGDYDSLFAEKGADLRNNEYIIYNEKQCTVEYIVEIGS